MSDHGLWTLKEIFDASTTLDVPSSTHHQAPMLVPMTPRVVSTSRSVANRFRYRC